MPSAYNGNDSKTSEQAEIFNSSEECRWIVSPSRDDKYNPDW